VYVCVLRADGTSVNGPRGRGTRTLCVSQALYTTIRRCAVNRHPPSSRPGSRHMRRQRSAGRDHRHCHGHTRETHPGSSYPTTTSPGRRQRGSCASPLSSQAGQGGGTRYAHPSATRNRPASRCTSDAPPPGTGTCYCGASSMASAPRLSRCCSLRPSRAHTVPAQLTQPVRTVLRLRPT
jgi:hypothetical protein